MPTYIVKLEKDGISKYLEWSTIVDAPITKGVSLEEFTEYYKFMYPDRWEQLWTRMALVKQHGVSSTWCTLDELISFNRAGDKESSLDFEGLWAKYCT